MRNIVIAAALAAGVLLVGPGSNNGAQAGAWCQTDQDMIIVNCSYVSFEQCRATVSGVGGMCLRNPTPEPAPAPHAPHARKKH